MYCRVRQGATNLYTATRAVPEPTNSILSVRAHAGGGGSEPFGSRVPDLDDARGRIPGGGWHRAAMAGLAYGTNEYRISQISQISRIHFVVFVGLLFFI